MKKALLAFSILFVTLCNAQRYYPKLDDMFLPDDDMHETVFYDEIAYFKEGLKTATKKVWMSNLQTSGNGNAAFYSLELIPKWVYEVNFLDTGMFLKYNEGKEDKTVGIPLTYHEYTDKRGEEKNGNGRMYFENGLSLEFPVEIMTRYSSEFRTDLPDGKCLFDISGVEYKFDPKQKSLHIDITGKFRTSIKMGKKGIDTSSVQKISVHAAKGSLTIDLTYTDPKKGDQIVNLITKKF
jgi:hypothetical protein